ncbi:MAG: NhaP-type Na+/H+ or K+/H+ antiporter [Maribacter sp.]|jgi:NhaP-type Na+/H+ or K+/H+ antiporter
MLELAGIVILGIIAQWVAWRTKVPAILPLIVIGLLVGPLSTLWTADGTKLIQPIFASGKGLFPGDMLFNFVSLAIGVILFEGGLTLKRAEIKDVGKAILNLIFIGSLVTFIGAALTTHYLMNMTWQMSFLFAGLIIVTGPTVIAPILRNVPLNRNVATVLKWEGILIDPIGALVAVLVFEFINTGAGGEFTGHALTEFAKIVAVGFTYGLVAAYGLAYMIKKEWIPHYLLNVFTLALVLLVFVGSNLIAHESGLLTVVVMGMVLGNLDVKNIKEILDFKESLSVLLISMLFILLSANMDIRQLEMINGNAIILFTIVVFVIRPLGVFLSTMNSNLNFKEKIFISWVGPRGIVAAGIASLFGLKLVHDGVADSELITPLVFMIVLGTVLLNATTARMVAKLLGVTREESDGILFVGAQEAARVIGTYLKGQGRHVVLMDRNRSYVDKAKKKGLLAFEGDVYTDDLNDSFDMVDVGYLYALTPSVDVNKKACEKYRDSLGENGTFRLLSPEELRMEKSERPAQGIFSYTDGYLNINEVARDFPTVHERSIASKKELGEFYDYINTQKGSIALFIKGGDSKLENMPLDITGIDYEEGMQFVYLGKEIKDV